MAAWSTSWPDLGRFWTIPNTLSLTRLVLVVPITVLLWVDGPPGWLLGLVVAAIATDWLDGRVARWTRTISDWGKVIDPIADKFAALMTVTALTFRAAEPHFPLWFFGVVVGRDALILLGSALIARRSGQIVMSAWAGKAATLWLALTVLAAVLKADPPVFNVCLWMTVGLLAFSFLVYVVRTLNAVRRPPPPAEAQGASSPPSASESASDAGPSAGGTHAAGQAPDSAPHTTRANS
jgi:CDP-diacylglycerol--glycerol-3-phosphate 3-phosphatidyltransferase